MAFGQVVYVGKFFLVCSELDLVGKHIAHIVLGVVELQQFRELAGVQYLLPFLAFIFYSSPPPLKDAKFPASDGAPRLL